MIKISGLLVQRNNRDVLDISSLDIKRGETLGVVGPNGAGKTTLLLILARLLLPARGEMIFDGQSLNQLDELEYRRKISFVFQSPLLLDMTVEQNVSLGLRFRGVSKEETRQRVGRGSRLWASSRCRNGGQACYPGGRRRGSVSRGRLCWNLNCSCSMNRLRRSIRPRVRSCLKIYHLCWRRLIARRSSSRII